MSIFWKTPSFLLDEVGISSDAPEEGCDVSASSAANVEHVAYVCADVFEDIATTVGARVAETGGLLLGPVGRDGISRFHFDNTAQTTSVTYSPDAERLEALCEAQSRLGYEIKGFVHSHPGPERPSSGDMVYVRRFFEENPAMTRFYMPILPSVPLRTPELAMEPGRDIFFWYVDRDTPSEYRQAKVELVHHEEEMPVTEESWSLPAEGGLGSSEVREQASPGALQVRTPGWLRKQEPALAERQEVERVAEPAFEGLDVGGLRALLCDHELSVSSVPLGANTLRAVIAVRGGDEVMALLPAAFPIFAPSLELRRGSESRRPQFQWAERSELTPEERLARLIRWAFDTQGEGF